MKSTLPELAADAADMAGQPANDLSPCASDADSWPAEARRARRRYSKRRRKCAREWFVAELKAGALRPLRGCTRLVIDIPPGDEPIEETSYRDPLRKLMTNIGDKLLAIAGDAIAMLTVTSIRFEGWAAIIGVDVTAGIIGDGSVHVTKGPTLRQQQEAKAREAFITIAFALAAIEAEDVNLAALALGGCP